MSRPDKPFVIGDDLSFDDVTPKHFGRGLVPRDYGKHPQGYSAEIPAWDLDAMPLIPRDEWVERIREKWANRATLYHLRRDALADPKIGKLYDALNQDGIGYCWIHSGTMATMLIYLKMGIPKRLSAFYGGCQIKNFRDQGGWGAAGVEWIAKNGLCDISLWPEPVGNNSRQAMSRSNLTPEAKANAELHKLTEGWADLTAAAYDRNMSWDQFVTCLINDHPMAVDRNHWGHSTCEHTACLGNPLGKKAADGRIVNVMETKLSTLDMNDPTDAAVMGEVINPLGTNSWSPRWGDLGDYIMTGKKAQPNGAVAGRAVTPSTN